MGIARVPDFFASLQMVRPLDRAGKSASTPASSEWGIKPRTAGLNEAPAERGNGISECSGAARPTTVRVWANRTPGTCQDAHLGASWRRGDEAPESIRWDLALNRSKDKGRLAPYQETRDVDIATTSGHHHGFAAIRSRMGGDAGQCESGNGQGSVSLASASHSRWPPLKMIGPSRSGWPRPLNRGAAPRAAQS
jgi:hypothetical protein